MWSHHLILEYMYVYAREKVTFISSSVLTCVNNMLNCRQWMTNSYFSLQDDTLLLAARACPTLNLMYDKHKYLIPPYAYDVYTNYEIHPHPAVVQQPSFNSSYYVFFLISVYR